MIYKLFALPTLETQEHLTTLFQGCPVPIDFDSFGVEIGSSRSEIRPVDQVYRAVPGLMDVWYETATQRSYWILPLFPSPEMVTRHEQVGDAWERDFIPFMVIAAVQNMERRNVAWMRSIASSMATTRPILTFHNELSTRDISIVPEQNDFYEAYKAKGEMNNDLFIDIQDTQD